MTYSKLLIANRGEIACRIARTARALGYRTVAVYSDADAGALHVVTCDEAVRIGPAAAMESYLSIPALIDAARRSGADAVHPGYGFLSENAAFARACLDAGLVFIGPPPTAIDAMGNKAAAKRRMIEAGVPCVPGYQGEEQSDAVLMQEARRIGYPVMVKAAAGGGGRGMRLVSEASDLEAALASARSEAAQAFGSDQLILEKAVVGARHVEIQVFADSLGGVVHLGERDCSVQRRHQKLIEEAPSPAVTTELRARMGAAAVMATRSIGYVGAGTVEFLLGADGAFYFLEMNTRLQVEHPVTELVTGIDLVAWQLRIARGEPLPLLQSQIEHRGHAIEVRLYAEDPTQNFLPQSGDVLAWVPPVGPGIRVDHGLQAQDCVSPFYDPMLAKIMALGETREEARHRLLAALRDTVLLGMTSNLPFLRAVLAHEAFAEGEATTGFIGTHFPPERAGLVEAAPEPKTISLAAALLLESTHEVAHGALAGWTSTGVSAVPVDVALVGPVDSAPQRVCVVVGGAATRFDVTIGAVTQSVVLAATDQRVSGRRRVSIDGMDETVTAITSMGRLHLATVAGQFVFEDRLRQRRGRVDAASSDELRAPMNGRVVRLLAKGGDKVRKGQCIVVLEAMKMQHEIVASRDGTIAELMASEGQQVGTRALLVTLA